MTQGKAFKVKARDYNGNEWTFPPVFATRELPPVFASYELAERFIDNHLQEHVWSDMRIVAATHEPTHHVVAEEMGDTA